MQRVEILERAKQIICGERQDQYGRPENNFQQIADYWTVYLNRDISAEDVAIMMTLFKIARIQTGTGTDDSWIDAVGYLALGSEIHG